MFYAISKRRRDINAAEDRGRGEGRVEGREEGREEGRVEGREEGRVEGRTEGREEGRTATLDDLAARLKDNPDAIAAIAEMRAQSQNGDHQ